LQVCALVAYLSYLKHAWLWEIQNLKPAHRTAVSESAAAPSQPSRTAA
jgi:hypothetical protein